MMITVDEFKTLKELHMEIMMNCMVETRGNAVEARCMTNDILKTLVMRPHASQKNQMA